MLAALLRIPILLMTHASSSCRRQAARAAAAAHCTLLQSLVEQLPRSALLTGVDGQRGHISAAGKVALVQVQHAGALQNELALLVLLVLFVRKHLRGSMRMIRLLPQTRRPAHNAASLVLAGATVIWPCSLHCAGPYG